jgi:hypothetical protein
MALGYYGIYRTRNSTASLSIATVKQEENSFPPGITYGGLQYALVNAVQVATPGQERAFQQYCEAHNIETDVNIYY